MKDSTHLKIEIQNTISNVASKFPAFHDEHEQLRVKPATSSMATTPCRPRDKNSTHAIVNPRNTHFEVQNNP